MIPDAHLEDFRQAYKQSYDEECSIDEARDVPNRCAWWERAHRMLAMPARRRAQLVEDASLLRPLGRPVPSITADNTTRSDHLKPCPFKRRQSSVPLRQPPDYCVSRNGRCPSRVL